MGIPYEITGPARGSGFVLGMDISIEREHDTSTNSSASGTSSGLGVMRVGLRGELDLAYAGTLRIVLTQLRLGGFSPVVLDQAELRFLSSAGPYPARSRCPTP